MRHFKYRYILSLLIILSAPCVFQSTMAETIKIKMEKERGVYMLPCTVNGLQLKLVLDTGASMIAISESAAQEMMDNGTLSESDFFNVARMHQADGSTYNAAMVKLREVNVGGFILKDVDAVITPSLNAHLLFGLSAIQKLGKISIKDNYLVIENPNVRFSGKEEDIAFLGLKKGTTYEECENRLKEKYGDNKVLYSSLNKDTYVLEVENQFFIDMKFDYISLYFNNDELGLVSVEAQKFFPSNELSKALRFRDSIYTFLKSKYKATKRGLDKGSKYNYYVLGYSHKKDNGLYPIKIDICRSKIIQGHTNDDTKLMDGYNVSIYYWPAAYDKIVKDYVHEDEY